MPRRHQPRPPRHQTPRLSRPPASQPAGTRDCARGQWCATATISPAGVTIPGRAARAFCETDWQIIGRCLRQDQLPADGLQSDLPALARRLASAIGDHVIRETRIRVPFGPSVPLRLDVDAHLRSMASRLASWEKRVTGTAGLQDDGHPDFPGLAEASEVIAVSSGRLHTHLTTLLGLQPAEMTRWLPLPPPIETVPVVTVAGAGRRGVLLSGADAGNEILWMNWLARAILLETPARRELLAGVPCRQCARLALWRAQPPQHDGDPEYWSECQYCSHRMTRDVYDQWVRANAVYYRAHPHDSPSRLAKGPRE